MDISQRRDLILRVYGHEISRRRQIQQEKPKAYRKLFAANMKRLSECCEGTHVWGPMTTLWIHDGAGKSYMIDGFKRRGFREAMPFKANGYVYFPQMCWNCVQTREKVVEDLTWAERQRTLADHIKADIKGKPRGKKGADLMLEDFDDLF